MAIARISIRAIRLAFTEAGRIQHQAHLAAPTTRQGK